MNNASDWKVDDRVWFIAKPSAEPIWVRITAATAEGWSFRSFDGKITGTEPRFTERLVGIVGVGSTVDRESEAAALGIWEA